MPELRNLTEEDAVRVALLEDRLFSDAWSEAGVRGGYSGRGGYLIGLWEQEQLLGYVIAGRVLDEGELFRIGVAPEEQGKGYGALLLDRMLADNPEIAVWRLDVRVSNENAIRLYRSRGFRTLVRNKNFYRDPLEDGFLMTRESC